MGEMYVQRRKRKREDREERRIVYIYISIRIGGGGGELWGLEPPKFHGIMTSHPKGSCSPTQTRNTSEGYGLSCNYHL